MSEFALITTETINYEIDWKSLYHVKEKQTKS